MNVMMPITTFGIAIISALCPLVNLELYMAGVGAFGHATGFWSVVLLAAAGQAIGKLFWYQVGCSSLKWSFIRRKTESPRWKTQFDKLKRQTEQRPLVAVGLVFASASAGLPPLAIMAVLTGQLHFSRLVFVGTTFVGRTLRFAVVLGGVSWFSTAVTGAP